MDPVIEYEITLFAKAHDLRVSLANDTRYATSEVSYVKVLIQNNVISGVGAGSTEIIIPFNDAESFTAECKKRITRFAKSNKELNELLAKYGRRR